MSFIAGYLLGLEEGGKKPVLQSIAITQYGDYEIKAPEGVDGYNPIHVNLKDRYDEGYADGEAAVKAKIQSKTITANGTYSAATDGLDGFDPVIVDVPDRYDEGYADGYADGTANGEYIFPDDTEYANIVEIVGGDTVTDHTTGYGFKVVVEDSGDRRKFSMCVVDTKGNVVEKLTGGQDVPLSWQAYVTHIEIKQGTGAWGYAEVTIRYYNNDTWKTMTVETGVTRTLAKFGASGHQMGVRNN